MKTAFITLSDISFFILPVILFSTPPRIGTKVPYFTIEDQHAKKWRSGDYVGKNVLYVLSDRSGYEYSENWTEPLVKKFGDRLTFVPVADVRSVPGFLKGLIRSKFEDEFKYPILMDWDGILIEAFSMVEDVPNLVLTNESGVVVYSTHGKGTVQQVNQLARQIEVHLSGS